MIKLLSNGKFSVPHNSDLFFFLFIFFRVLFLSTLSVCGTIESVARDFSREAKT